MTENNLRVANEIRIFNAILLKLIREDQEERLKANFPGLSGLRLGVLQILQVHTFTLAELSDHMMLAPPSLVPVIDRLERDSFIVRMQDPNDRRKNPLVLTKKGIKLLKETPDFDRGDRLALCIEVMDPEEARRLNCLLQDLVRLMSPDEDVIAVVKKNLDRQGTGKEG